MNNSPEIQERPDKGNRLVFRRLRALSYLVVLLAIASVAYDGLISVNAVREPGEFKVGERLTYNISFNNFDSAAYAEIRVVSRGKLDGKDAVELFGKLRSSDLLSAAFYLWDFERTTYVSPESGFPLLVREVSKTGLIPKRNGFQLLKRTFVESRPALDDLEGETGPRERELQCAGVRPGVFVQFQPCRRAIHYNRGRYVRNRSVQRSE